MSPEAAAQAPAEAPGSTVAMWQAGAGAGHAMGYPSELDGWSCGFVSWSCSCGHAGRIVGPWPRRSFARQALEAAHARHVETQGRRA